MRTGFLSHVLKSPDWAAFNRVGVSVGGGEGGEGQRKGGHLGASLSLLNGFLSYSSLENKRK